jgi:23S rRNA (adenine2030-N6)-methyltransferase
MFSYRHAFHAGNHADVLKHTVLIAILKHLTAKDAALTVIDTHAGAGLYRLDGDYSSTGGEAVDGIFKLFSAVAPTGTAKSAIKEIVKDVVPPLQDYIDLVASFNRGGQLKVYPGSPFVVQSLLRDEARDKLKLFELHPTDHKALVGHIEQLQSGRQVAVERKDGFEGLKSFLPPPVSATGSRRALVLIDPSYEIKTDYGTVASCIQDCLKRFATGTYAVWYPVIPRPEAHELPRRLKTLATQAGKPWLHATLNIGQGPEMSEITVPGERAPRPGLTASGMFVINPPHTLKATLQATLPQLLAVLGRGRGKGWTVDGGG